MSGGLTPCRQLRPSSRRERASNSHMMGGGTHKSLYSGSRIKVGDHKILATHLRRCGKDVNSDILASSNWHIQQS